MGSKVLSTKYTGTKNIRAYAHCARESQGITLLLINLSGNTTSQAFVTPASNYTTGLKHHIPRTLFNLIPRLRRTAAFTREEYHLTAKDGNLHSQTMLLNGNVLSLDSDGNIPTFEPMEVDASLPITVAPFSIVFVHIPHFYAPACR